MLQRLKRYIHSQELCANQDRLLVTVSGGIDSVVLLNLLIKASYSCAIAHCNFQLRGKESDFDEKFVEGLGEKYGIKTHTISLDTIAYAKAKGISTQMAARNLRYEWFSEIAELYSYTWIAIAHNANDSIETFHLNLARGTGLSGIIGISPKSGMLIRPLLWASRKDISQYCESENISYREDSSNAQTNYKRNYLRHEILPKFQKLNPSYQQTILKNQEFFRQSNEMLDFFYSSLLKGLLVETGKDIQISIPKLLELPEPSWFLFRFLSSYGYNSTHILDINISLHTQSGKQFKSDTHLLVRDRDNLILCELSETESSRYYLEVSNGRLSSPIQLNWETIDADNYIINPDSNLAALDAGLLEFPLLLRNWQEGDYFYPLGMDKNKKLSDFFIDNKISIIEKRKIWILLSGNKIVWIIGHRIDNRFKINPETKQVLQIKNNL